MKTLGCFILTLVCCSFQLRADLKRAQDAQQRGDYATARKEFIALAEQGDDRSMVTLGIMYHSGTGVERDYAKAMDWYLKALAKRNADAFSNIGVLYRDGLGVETNRPIAYALFYIVHMRGLGTEATQVRAGRNLDRTAAQMSTQDIEDTLKMTERYVLTFVEKRGRLDPKENDLKFSKKYPTLSSMR